MSDEDTRPIVLTAALVSNALCLIRGASAPSARMAVEGVLERELAQGAEGPTFVAISPRRLKTLRGQVDAALGPDL